jgi:heat-inducible transcriptional repressor
MNSKKNDDAENLFKEMTSRSMQVFKKVVETYLETGDPVGSRTLSRSLSERISAATVRNVLQDLEILGLLGSTHVSSGRMPTQSGLRLFVDGFLEVGDMNGREKTFIEKTIKDEDIFLSKSFDRVGSLLSGLTKTASVVLTPKIEPPIKHIDFVTLYYQKGLQNLCALSGPQS